MGFGYWGVGGLRRKEREEGESVSFKLLDGLLDGWFAVLLDMNKVGN